MKHWFTRFALWVLLLLAARAGAASPTPVAPPPADHSLEFIPNRGQHDRRARYVAELRGGRLFLEDNAFTYALVSGLPSHHAGPERSQAKVRSHAVRVGFEQANARPLIREEKPSGAVRNYFRGPDPSRWARRVPGYRQLRYVDLWPGINLKLYENARQQLEYDFLLAPHANPARIVLRYSGADALRLDDAGNLVVSTSAGTLKELAPRAWQTDARGQRQAVSCRYVLAGTRVRFQLGAYDKSRPLIIDPTVVFSSYTGSTADNWGFTATYDQQGNLYSGGIVFGVGYPASPGAQDATFNGECDMALIKFSPAVSGPAARVWATYLGGSSTEFPHSIVANAAGELVVLGTTSSANYPVTAGVFQPQFAGGTNFEPYGYTLPYSLPNGSDLVITRLGAAGDTLLASTFLGGGGNDGLLDPLAPQPRLCRNYGDPFRGDILLDAQGTVYLASTTASSNFPTANSFGTAFRGGTDAVVCALAPNLGSLRWSTYLGGTGPDAAYSLQLNAGGDLFVTGGTASTDFPVTTGAYQPQHSGDVDGFVARIAAGGSTLRRATYLGTSAYDQAYFLQLDLSGDVYLLGQTLGTVPVSPGRYGVPGSRQYVQKLSANLDSLRFSTVFGTGPGRINISPTAFLVDQCDRVYISGWGGGVNTSASSFNFRNGTTWGLPVTPNAVQATTDSADFYLAQFSPGMAQLQYATFLGNNDRFNGDHVDGGTCRFDPRGFIYHAVCSCGGNGSFPIPPGANTFSPQSGFSNCNNAAFKLNFETIPITTGTDSVICATAVPRRLIGTPAGGTWTGPGVTGNAASGYFFTPSLALVGVQVLTYSISGASICGSSAPLRVRVTMPPVASFAPLPQTSFCLGRTPPPAVALSGTPAGGTFSGPGVVGTSFFPAQAGPGQHTLTYTYVPAALACPVTATRAVTVADSIRLRLPADTTLCAGGPALALAAQPPGGTWAGPGVSGSAATGFVFSPSAALPGVQTLTYTAPGTSQCGGVGSRRITVALRPVPVIQPLPLGTTYCVGSASVPLSGTPAGGTFSGPGVTGNVFDPTQAGAGAHQISYTVTSAAGCAASIILGLTVLPAVTVRLPADTTVCAGSPPLRLTAQPPGGTWAGPGVSGSAANGFIFSPSATLPGVQTLTYTAPAANICGGMATRRVTLVPVPVARIEPLPSYTYCLGSPPVPLAGTPAGGTFSGPGVTGNAFDPTQAGAGAHQVRYTVTSAAGCAASTSIGLTVLPAVTVRLPADTTVCVASAALPLVASPGGGTWAGPGVSGNAATGFVFSPSAALPGVQTLTYAAPGANVCGGTATRRVVVVPVPVARIEPLAAYTYCLASASVAVAGTPAGGTFSGPGVRGNLFSPTLAGIGQHVLTYTYRAPGLDCPASATIVVQVTANLLVQAPPDTVVCGGQSGRLALRATPPGGSWSGPGVSGAVGTGFFFSPPPGATGPLLLRYTATAGTCTATATRRVEVVPVPSFTAFWNAASACAGNYTGPLRLRFGSTSSLSGAEAGTITWDFGDGSRGNGPALEHVYNQPGTYQPRATLTHSRASCQVTEVLPPVVVREQQVPNVITPDNDGNNDTFKPTYACEPRLRIYSRWGRLVYESAAYRNDWGAEGQPPGLYYYRLETAGSAPVQGWVEVIK